MGLNVRGAFCLASARLGNWSGMAIATETAAYFILKVSRPHIAENRENSEKGGGDTLRVDHASPIGPISRNRVAGDRLAGVRGPA